MMYSFAFEQLDSAMKEVSDYLKRCAKLSRKSTTLVIYHPDSSNIEILLNNTPVAQEMGRKGGRARSEAKTLACRENAKKPRRRKSLSNISSVTIRVKSTTCENGGK